MAIPNTLALYQPTPSIFQVQFNYIMYFESCNMVNNSSLPLCVCVMQNTYIYIVLELFSVQS